MPLAVSQPLGYLEVNLRHIDGSLLKTNKKNMSYANGIISPPVSIHDVQRALGTGEIYLGMLCIHANINKWARYKPERADGQTMLIHGDNSSGTRSRKANNFGLEIPFCSLAVMNEKVYNLLNHDETGWDYLTPRGDRTAQGGDLEFYRLTDFVRIPGDTTDPYNSSHLLSGYNHLAHIPFDVFLNESGAVWKRDSDGDYLEVNVQVANQLVFSFINSVGYDLHLQDFITIADYGNNKRWRPVLQVFNGYVPAGGDEWYEKSQPDVEVAGGAITTNQETVSTVTLDLNTANFTPFINVNESFHLCIGVGCCDQSDPLVWKEPDGPLFIIPYTDAQLQSDIDVPFYYRFKLVSYQARRLNITALSFYASGIETWVNAGGTAPYFTIHSLATGYVFLTMTISKLPTQKVDFVGENGTPDTGYDPLKIQAREMISGTSGETIKYLSPANSSKQSVSHVHIDEGQTSETQTIYATMYLGNIPVGGYGEYHMYAFTGATDQQGNPSWDNIGYFGVQKLNFSNS